MPDTKRWERIREGNAVMSVAWKDLESGTVAEPLLCDSHRLNAFQVVGGPFTRVVIEGDCGGGFNPICSVNMPCTKSIESGVVWVRPVVEGGTATIYAVVRR